MKTVKIALGVAVGLLLACLVILGFVAWSSSRKPAGAVVTMGRSYTFPRDTAQYRLDQAGMTDDPAPLVYYRDSLTGRDTSYVEKQSPSL